MKLKAWGKADFSHSAKMCADIFMKDLSDEVYTQHGTVMQEFTPDA